MSTAAQTFELLTPCFCAGSSKAKPEMRVASVRGQLRWWARVLHGTDGAEYRIFGGIDGTPHGYAEKPVASSFKLTLIPAMANPDPDDYCLVPHHQNKDGYWVGALSPKSRYTLAWSSQPHPQFQWKPDDVINGKTRRQLLEQSIKAWLLLGTLGRRSTRATGSVWPVNYAPTMAEFDAAVTSLGLPATVRVRVLNAATPDPTEDATALRAIADKTVHGLREGTLAGNPLGFVNGSKRKASPVRFKVGHFAFSFLMIKMIRSIILKALIKSRAGKAVRRSPTR